MKKKSLLLAGVVTTALVGAPTAGYAKMAGGSGTTSTTSTSTTSLNHEVSQTFPLTFQASTDLSLICSQTGSTVRLGFGLESSATARAHLKVAFTNPSVSWKGPNALGNGSEAGWYKPSGKSSWQVATPDTDFTTVEVTLTPGAVARNKTETNVTGNPYVYYQDLTPLGTQTMGVDQYAPDGGTNYQGHCNQGNGNAQVALGRWSLSTDLGNRGRFNTGSCVTSSKSTSASLTHRNNARTVRAADAVTVIYSNKVLDATNFYTVPDGEVGAGDRYLRLASGGETNEYKLYDAATKTALTNDQSWKGYHIWFGTQTVSGETDPIDFTKIWDKNSVHGIGGNPRLWLGVGENIAAQNAVNPYEDMGRCNGI